jgi:squalene synthase HpnC
VSGLPAELRAAYARCAAITRSHYENFQVVSWFVPRRLRPGFWAVYAFCRGVDDLGDEYPGDREAALDAWEAELRRCWGGRPTRPEFLALQDAIRRYELPAEPFFRLVEANRRDQRVHRYATFAELRAYTACSADPVGRLVLALWGIRDPGLARLSDETCTALQLTNFWQDMARDAAQGRLYVPLEDLARFGLTEDEVLGGRPDRERLAALLAFEGERTRTLFRRGAALEARVPPRLALQLRLYRLGGTAVLDALERQGWDPFARRPTVGGRQKLVIALRALRAGGAARALWGGASR